MPTRVRGVVLSTDGRTPASGVQVEAFDPGTGFSQGSATTDVNGNFILSGLEDRTWAGRTTTASSNRFVQLVKETWVEDEPHAQRTTLSAHGHGQLRDVTTDDHHAMVHDHSSAAMGGTTISPAVRTTLPYVAVSAAYPITSADGIIDCTGGPYNVTLPDAAGITGRYYVIKNSGTGVVTVVGTGGDTIDGGASAVLQVQYVSITVYSDGTNWKVM